MRTGVEITDNAKDASRARANAEESLVQKLRAKVRKGMQARQQQWNSESLARLLDRMHSLTHMQQRAAPLHDAGEPTRQPEWPEPADSERRGTSATKACTRAFGMQSTQHSMPEVTTAGVTQCGAPSAPATSHGHEQPALQHNTRRQQARHGQLGYPERSIP